MAESAPSKEGSTQQIAAKEQLDRASSSGSIVPPLPIKSLEKSDTNLEISGQHIIHNVTSHDDSYIPDSKVVSPKGTNNEYYSASVTNLNKKTDQRSYEALNSFGNCASGSGQESELQSENMFSNIQQLEQRMHQKQQQKQAAKAIAST